jgi:GntR family transcriptional repressor for pyruvate dehydrogenase complex
MTPLFRVAKQNRIFQDVVEQIQEAIIQGHLKVGDRLPAERELKEMMQTSRSTLREALRVLEQKGLIEIKLGMGGGAVVKAVSSDLVAESLDLLIRSRQVSLRHIAEFRERVEGDVVRLATSRLKDADIG